MQRLVLAVIVLAILVVVLAALLSGLRGLIAPKDAGGRREDDSLQKLAFVMLAALMVYAATTGAS